MATHLFFDGGKVFPGAVSQLLLGYEQSSERFVYQWVFQLRSSVASLYIAVYTVAIVRFGPDFSGSEAAVLRQFEIKTGVFYAVSGVFDVRFLGGIRREKPHENGVSLGAENRI